MAGPHIVFGENGKGRKVWGNMSGERAPGW